MAAFAGLTEAQRERLEMLAEEASEVVHAVTKILRHGYDSYNPHEPGAGSNRDQLVRELADFDAVSLTMIHEGDFPLAGVDYAERWMRKLRFTHHQGKEG